MICKTLLYNICQCLFKQNYIGCNFLSLHMHACMKMFSSSDDNYGGHACQWVATSHALGCP